MRIIAGTKKGQRLTAPDGAATRPTSDRVREALFNVIEHGLRPCAGARVLDLFAGTGALAFEALSRGAETAVLVDDGAPARGAIRDNMERLGFAGRAKLLRRDATRLGPRPPAFAAPFDLVFCDPPYRKGLGALALASALAGGWLAADAHAILEMAGDDADEPPSGFTQIDRRRYGQTDLMILAVDGQP